MRIKPTENLMDGKGEDELIRNYNLMKTKKRTD